MNTIARVRNMQRTPGTRTVAASGTIDIHDNTSFLSLSAASAVTLATTGTLVAGRIIPGRQVRFVGTDDTNTVTFTSTAPGSAGNGSMSLGSATRVLGNADSMTVQQLASGAWYEIGFSSVS